MKHKILRFIKHALLFAAVVAAIGVIYQWMATRRDRALYPPPGKFVSVNDQTYHIVCRGERETEQSPVVVIEAGRDSSSLNWLHVVDKMAQFSQVCVYDRVGLGWSAPGTAYLDSIQVNENMHALLQAANVEPPYVLVGHSIGGILVRDYYHQHPENVAGLVLVDGSSTKQFRNWTNSERYETARQVMKASAPVGTALGRMGVLRLYRAIRYDTPAHELVALARRNEAHFFRARVGEMLMVGPMVGRLEEPKSLGDLPLRVIEQTVAPSAEMSERQIARKAEWHGYQTEIAGLSTNSKQIEAPNSGHNIPIDNPDIIVSVVRELLAELNDVEPDQTQQ